MNTPHKWAEVIKAWADGYIIQYRGLDDEKGLWHDWPSSRINPCWHDKNYEFRVKPELKEAGDVLKDAWFQQFAEHRGEVVYPWQAAAEAVIRAYKAGELKDIK